jgi:hypothetical protein
MSTTAGRIYRLDFSGRHNIATGMLNTALTAVTAAVVAHVATATGALEELQAALTLATVTVLGVMMTLVWGAFARKAPSGPTVAHRIACWIGAGAWTSLLAFREWTTSTLITYGAALAATTAVVGFIGWLQSPSFAGGPSYTEEAALREEAAYQQAIRNDLGAEWEDRIRRVCRLAVKIPAIEPYKAKTSDGRSIGNTLEIHMPPGGASWQTLLQHKTALESDAQLGPGCDINIRMGATRRIALVDLTTVNVLDEEQLYPNDYSPLSIKGPIPMMVDRRGLVCGPSLREQNCGIFGEGGSGKSNAGQVIGAGIARMVDAHLCDIDVTGTRLSMPLIRPYLEGRAKNPVVFWSAWNMQEAILMLRALNRAALARNNAYNDLKYAMGDDKMPISAEFPQFVVRCDEIKHVVSCSADPVVYTLMKRIVDDHRDPGFRAIMLGLRGTNEIINQGVQAQLHNLGVLRAQSKAEYVAVFGGQASGIDPTDAPYPGCIQMRLGSAQRIQPYHVWRLVGKQLDDIAVAVSDYQPGVDAVTWLALNGRDVHGKPFSDLLPGELDCCATRWTRFKKAHGYETDDQQDQDASGQTSGLAGRTKTVDQAQEEMKEAVRRVQEAIAKRKEQEIKDDENRRDIEKAISESNLDEELSRIFGCDMTYVAPDPWDNPTVEPQSTAPDNWEATFEIIKLAGKSGIEMSAIHTRLAEKGVRVDRATVHKWLKAMTVPGAEYADRIQWRPDRAGGRNGRWYLTETEK